MICAICGSARPKKEWDLRGDRSRTICHCPDCGVSFLFPQLDDKELKQLYSEDYYQTWGLDGEKENEVTRRMKRATFRLRLDLIRRFVAGGAVLDVGCATGYFLEEARDMGFETYGVEYSQYSASIAKKKFGEGRVFEGILEESRWPDGNFDLVAMSDLIEHVRQPVKTLSKATALLKKGGVVMIMTPDTGSLSARLMRKNWTHYKPEHFYYFNRRSLELLAGRCGLSVAHYERSRKALNLDYLHTQFRTYRHWLMTPLVNVLHAIFPASWNARNFYFSIGEMVVVLKK